MSDENNSRLSRLWRDITPGQAVVLGAIIALLATVPTQIVAIRALLQREDESLVHFLDQEEAYDRAREVLRDVVQRPQAQQFIVNMRSTKDTQLQNDLYDDIVEALHDNPALDFTRITTYESDPHLWITRRFLEEAGEVKGFRMIYTFGSPTLPSSFISRQEAILGLLAGDGSVSHGLEVVGPLDLVRRMQDMYVRVYSDPDELTHVVKGKEVLVSSEEIEGLLKGLAETGDRLGKTISNWNISDDHPARSDWIAEDQ